MLRSTKTKVILMDIEQVAKEARRAATRMAALDGGAKNKALAEIIRSLLAGQARIVAANRRDLEQADAAQAPALR